MVDSSIQISGLSGTPVAARWESEAGETPEETSVRLAANLAWTFPPEDYFGMAEDVFEDALFRLVDQEALDADMKGIRSVVGGECTPYHIWWSYVYCHFYRVKRLQDKTYQQANGEICEILGLTQADLHLYLSYPSVAFLTNLFFDYLVEQMRGFVSFEIFLKALQGDPKFSQMYQDGFNRARSKQNTDIEVGVGISIDETKLTTEELVAKVKKLRKDTGQVADRQ